MSIVTPVKPEQNQLTPSQMMAAAEQFALAKTIKPTGMTIALAMMAGLFIGIAFVFYITVTTANVGLGFGVNKLLGGVVFSLGLILVVLCGGELFTSTVLSLISAIRKEVSVSRMLSVWGKVYLGNFFGAIALVALVMAAKLYLNADGQWGVNALKVAQHKLHHTPLQAFSLGVLCNLLVCLAVWLTFCTKNNGTKALLMVLPVALFVSSGFEHCIANLFMVPLGIAISNGADASFWQQVNLSSAAFVDLTWGHFIVNNLIPVTLGNIVGGGVLVGLANYAIYRPLAGTNSERVLAPQEIQTNSAPKVVEIMDRKPVLLSQDMSLATALRTLEQANITEAPVVDQQQRLLGYFCHQRVLVDLWCHQYQQHTSPSLAELIQSPSRAVDASNDITAVADTLKPADCANRVDSQGYLVGSAATNASGSENWQIVAVVDQGKVVGTLTKIALASSLFQQQEALPLPLAQTA